MRRSVLVFVLATAAAVVIPACRQRQAGQNPQQTVAGHESQANLYSPPGREVEPGEDVTARAGPQVAEGPEVGKEPEVGDEPQAGQSAGGADAEEEPLLLLDDEPSLLLNDGSFAPTGPVADNSRCHHCHLNYVDEDMAVVHAHANIGCADCHGNCDEHIADESWASGGNGTPPEIMYTREKINPCCLECHPKDELGKLKHESFLAGKTKEKYCTDCHGQHRLTERKCKWK